MFTPLDRKRPPSGSTSQNTPSCWSTRKKPLPRKRSSAIPPHLVLCKWIPQRQDSGASFVASASQELLIYLKIVSSSAGLLVSRPALCRGKRVNSEFEPSHTGIAAAFHGQPASGFHLGRLHLEFPDRGRDKGRRPRTQHLGRLLSERRNKEPRRRRYRMRPLPPLSGGCRPDETAGRSGLPILGRLAAGAAAGTRVGQ